MTFLHLGKTPARPGAVKFKLSNYFSLPAVPKTFPDPKKIPVKSYGMLGNDEVGDCVIAGAMHEHMLWTREGGGLPASFSTDLAIKTYSAITGYNPQDPNTDQGTDMEAAAKYRRQVGIKDINGAVHKIGAYLALDHTDPDTLSAAAYIFDAVGVGIQFPSTAMDQFNAGKTWTYNKKATIEGGHYVPLFYKPSAAMFQVVTWGQVQTANKAFLANYADEAVVYLSQEFLDGSGKTPDGFDLTQLQDDLKMLAR